MKLDEIMKLTEAGWTKDEIIALAGIERAQEPPKVEEPPKEEELPKEPPKDETPKEDPNASKLDSIISKLESITSGIQAANIRGSRMPERETAEEALARIINPYLDKEE